MIKSIIKKIKAKDKELEGLYVAVDDLGNIIGLGKSQKEIENIAHNYVNNIFVNQVVSHINVRRIKLCNMRLRKKLRNYI